MRCWLSLAIAFAATCSATEALAQDSSERTVAEALFREAKTLMSQGKYALACPKLAESQRLDPGGGTLLNLAVCHEKQGRTATAWTEFHDALAQATREGRADRRELAEQHIAALDPVLARVSVVVSPEVAVDGLSVKIADAELPRIAWGTAVPVDPGNLMVSASAPAHKAWTTTVEVKAGSTVTVQIQKLDRAPETAHRAAHDASGPGREPAQNLESGTKRTLSYVIGGVGVVGAGVGTYFGLHAISLRHQSNAECPHGACSTQGVALNDQALRSANISNVGFGVAIVGLGLGTYLFLTSHPAGSAEQSSAQARSIAVDALAGPGVANVTVSGRW